MRYPSHDDLPVADGQDLAAALASDDPRAYIAERQAALHAVGLWVTNEDDKWAKALGAVDLFLEKSPKPQFAVEDGLTLPPFDLPKRPDAPKTRRAALSALFHEQPDRVWRTRDLADEIERRGWAGPSGNESNKVSRVLSIMVGEGEIEQLRKGSYRAARAQPDPRPQTLEETIE